jgi:Rrf2 family nitric oxide-sensitive transcriptional repressor
MQITAFSDYALRVLLYLGLQTSDRLATIQEIAAAYAIPQNHLMKVVRQLGIKGYIETRRGKGGGIRLLQRPEDIVIGQVLRDTEDNLNLVECFSPADSHCVIQPACRLQGILHGALAAMFAELDRHTLAELLQPRGRLRGVLAPPPARRGAPR